MVIIRQAATYSHEADIGSVLLPKDKYLPCSFTVLYLFLVHTNSNHYGIVHRQV